MKCPECTSEFENVLMKRVCDSNFTFSTPLKHEQVKYGELINLDLNYFKLTDFDTRLANNEDLKRADQELKSNHGDFLAQFYNVAENIVRFVQELNTFIQDVEEGIFLQCSLEAIFQDNEGKQLMVGNN